MNGLRAEIKNCVRLLALDNCLNAFTTARNIKVALERNCGGSDTVHQRVEGEITNGGHVTGTTPLKHTDIRRPIQTGSNNYPNPHIQPPHLVPPKVETPHPTPYSPPSFTHPPKYKGVRHITRAEPNKRQCKSLCFKCAHPFSPQHKCSKGYLRVLLLSDDEDVGAKRDLFQSSEKRVEGEAAADSECQILKFMGLFVNPARSPQTLKLTR